MDLNYAIKNLSEIIKLCEDDINNSNDNVTAILDFEDLKSLQIVLRELKTKEE